jgi:lipopolysaccharide/colanic/teichoic acid biosynthesis glycosyltransferase
MLPLYKEPEIAEECWPARQRTGRLDRAFDVFCACAGTVILSPLFVAIAVAIKLDDGGAVFYRQVRIGKNFRHFRLWKFRSMVTGSDRKGFLTAPSDSRLTRSGRWLRRYKLDELPQLLNVIAGDMQLVGSRPEVEHYVSMFRPQYAAILQERPGITDPASLAYCREDQRFSSGNIEEQYVKEILPAKLKLSLEYQKNRTWLSDLRVLLQTVFGLIC